MPRRACPAERVRVAVVGAGAAGLGAALELARRAGTSRRGSKALEVVILEASQHIGGRIRTVRNQGEAWDLGATWVHGKGTHHNPMWAFIEEPRSAVFKERQHKPAQHVCWVNGESGTRADGDAVRMCTRAYEEALEECRRPASGLQLRGLLDEGTSPPANVGEAVSRLLDDGNTHIPSEPTPTQIAVAKACNVEVDLAARAFWWRSLLECSISGCDVVSELSLQAWGECEEPPGAICASRRWDGGYQSLVHAAASHLPTWVDIRLGWHVSVIDWSRSDRVVKTLASSSTGEVSKVTLTCCDSTHVQEVVEADHVIFTGSLGVLKSCVEEGGKPSFQPPLPDAMVQSIRRLGFGTVDKVLLCFNTKWWEPFWTRLYVLWDPSGRSSIRGEPSWVQGVYGFNPAPRGQGLECWLSGTSAREMETFSDADVIACLSTLLHRCCSGLGMPSPPVPEHVVRSSWGSDELFRGSYSYVPAGASGTDVDELAAPVGCECELVLAGEHTHRTSYSYAHGAWLSGVRAAEQIARWHGL